MAWASEAPTNTPEPSGWASEAAPEQTPPAAKGWASETPKEIAQPEMPGPFEALGQGLISGFKGVKQTAQVADPEALKVEKESPAAAPFEWSDIVSPVSKLAPKLGYQVGKSWPTIGLGIAGAGAGAVTPIPGGAIAGGAAGAAIGTVAQSLGPIFAAELEKSPQDPEGAWNRSLSQASISGMFSGAGWAAFPIRAFQGPVKQLLFQAFGVQPAVAVGERVAQNVAAGRDTTEGVEEAYRQGVIGTAVPAVGQYAASRIFRGRTADVRRTPEEEAILARVGKEESGFGIPSKEEVFDSLNRLYSNVKDDLNPIRQARNILTGGQRLAAEVDPYILARLTRGSTGKAEHFIEHSTFDPQTLQDTGRGLKQILEPFKDDPSGFRAYMIARRNIELHDRGIRTDIPINESRAVVNRGHNEYAGAFQDYLHYNDQLLNYLVKSGIISQSSARAMRDMNRDYVPFYRLMDEKKSVFGLGLGLKVKNPIYGIEGSGRKVLDPIETTIRNTFSFIALADRNVALRALEELAIRSPRGTDILRPIAQSASPIRVSPQEIMNGLAGQGITTSGTPNALTIFRRQSHNPKPDEIVIFNNGKPNYYKVDPYLAKAVNGLDREGLGLFTRMLAIPAKAMRAGITLSYEYMARNLGRDQMSAFILSLMGRGHRRGYIPFYEAMQGAGEILGKKEAYRNWLKSGGAGATLASIDQNYIKRLVDLRTNPTFMGSMKNVITSPLHGLRAMGELVENATRVGEYKRLMDAGLSPQAAGFQAREITLDFQKMGFKMRGANAIISFLNSHAEGLDRTGRAFVANPLQFTAKAMAAITAPSVMLWFANKDDPRYKEIPRWQKDLFWLIMTDNWQTISEGQAKSMPKGYTRQLQDGSWQVNKGNIWRIPKPFEMGVIFGTIPERLLDAFYAKNPDAFKGMGGTLKNIFLPNYVPQAVSPMIEHMANESLFTGRPLIPQYLEDLIPKEQWNPYTTDTAKLAGKMLSSVPGMERGEVTSPIIIQNYVRAYTGGLGMHLLDASDWALRQAGVVPSPVRPTLTNADKTLIKAFAVRFPEAGANSIQDFYEESKKREQAKKTVAHLRKSYQPEGAKELAQQENLATADAIKKAMGTQLKMVRDAYLNPNMSPEKKRDFIDTSYLQIIRMAQQGNEMFKKTEAAFQERRKPKASEEAGWGPQP